MGVFLDQVYMVKYVDNQGHKHIVYKKVHSIDEFEKEKDSILKDEKEAEEWFFAY